VIARSLHDLVKKDQKWDWTEKQKKIFQKLKKRFTKELVLSIPDLDKKMRMEVNADVLDYTADGKLRPVVYLSKSLNKIERNYEIYDKEMLTVIRGLENWRHLLESAKFKFQV